MQLMLQLRQFAVHVHDGAAHLRRQPGAAGADALGALAQLPQVVDRLADTQLVPGLDGFPSQVRLPVEPLYAVANSLGTSRSAEHACAASPIARSTIKKRRWISFACNIRTPFHR